jgi:glutamate-1-semialdehyde aminotransferase
MRQQKHASKPNAMSAQPPHTLQHHAATSSYAGNLVAAGAPLQNNTNAEPLYNCLRSSEDSLQEATREFVAAEVRAHAALQNDSRMLLHELQLQLDAVVHNAQLARPKRLQKQVQLLEHAASDSIGLERFLTQPTARAPLQALNAS